MINLKGTLKKEQYLEGFIEKSKGVTTYQELIDKPQINGVVLEGNKLADELLLQKKLMRITNEEIEEMFK